ncbi:hypothetical protein BSLG_005692 [Batrachochytrium salamandrivorans]|nr:hypothetical protein BSLG_005692 [Batrachochytrium salamandrivorans]
MTYQILCSHRQFNTYLADMGSLELEIIRNARSTGYVSIKFASILANPAKSFNGILPIHSRRGAHRNMQLGLAQVSLAILSLPTHTTPSSHGTTKLAGLAGSLLPQTDIHSKPSKFMTQGMNAHDTPAGSDNFKYKSSDSNFGSVPENVDQIPLSLSDTDLAFSTQSIFPDMHDQTRDAVDLESVSHLESAFDLDSYASDESIDRILTDHYVIEALKSEAGHQLLDRDGVLVIDDDSYQLSTDASRTSSISEKFSDDENIDKTFYTR